MSRRTAIYNEPTAASLHLGLARELSEILGTPIKPSYCYLACYYGGSVLDRHRDRPQCEWNLSLAFDTRDLASARPRTWPLYLELEDGPKAIHLRDGDGLLYRGAEVDHWREALPDEQTALVGLYHFVSAQFDGPLG